MKSIEKLNFYRVKRGEILSKYGKVNMNQVEYLSNYQNMNKSITPLSQSQYCVTSQITRAQTIKKYIEMYEKLGKTVENYMKLVNKDINTIKAMGDELINLDEELANKLK